VVDSFAELPWLQPYPDSLLDADPDSVVVARETIELAFVATMQLLPPQQRAVLIMRDVIGWSAAEAAQIMELSVPAVNSALQRARATLRSRGQEPVASGRTVELSAEERSLLRRYVELHERPDVPAMAKLVRNDIRITMPPQPVCYDGWDLLAPLHAMAFGPEGFGDWRVLPTRMNRLPAAACYLRPRGAEAGAPFEAYKLDVIRMADGLIAEITTFEAHLFPAFGLPATLD
jgi:RNA polymerase sigma-70 factor (TIGR02960 family)